MIDPHLAHRKDQERAHWNDAGADPFDSLVTVELNITELCNRKCVFCPRVDPKIYPNRNLHMKPPVVRAVADGLYGSKARVSISGFGEPLLHPQLAFVVAQFQGRAVEINTNGDRLTGEKILRLFGAGLSWLYVNMYDGPHQEPIFRKMFEAAGETRYKLRPHWGDDHGLVLNNRSGCLSGQENKQGQCFYPFYKMLVDWNGDVLFCSNDWGRKIVVGNVLRTPLKEIWLSDKMREIRLRLAKGDRSHSPCNACSVQGTLTGRESFNLLMDHYG